MLQIQITEDLTLAEHGHCSRKTFTVSRTRGPWPVESNDSIKAAVARGIEEAIRQLTAAAKARRDTHEEQPDSSAVKSS